MEIKLSDAVESVREELLYAASRGGQSDLGFAVGPIEMEFTVELRIDSKLGTGVKAWVIAGDLSANVARNRAHKVKITLTPRQVDATDLLIASERSNQ